MSDPLNRFEALARLAREESAPLGDVSARTLAAIRAPGPRWYARPMMVCAAAYSVVGVAGVAAAYWWYAASMADPLATFLAYAIEIAP